MMNSETLYGFRAPFFTLATSIVVFFSGTLFLIPGICSGPGLLGIDNQAAAFLGIALYLLGLAGFGTSLIWLFVRLWLGAWRDFMRQLEAHR